MCPGYLILLGYITAQNLVRSKDHKAPHYVVFSMSLSPRPSQAQISPQNPTLCYVQFAAGNEKFTFNVSHPEAFIYTYKV